MNEDLEYQLYRLMCGSCPNAKKCHEECETCEEYDDELARIKKENR